MTTRVLFACSAAPHAPAVSSRGLQARSMVGRRYAPGMPDRRRFLEALAALGVSQTLPCAPPTARSASIPIRSRSASPRAIRGPTAWCSGRGLRRRPRPGWPFRCAGRSPPTRRCARSSRRATAWRDPDWAHSVHVEAARPRAGPLVLVSLHARATRTSPVGRTRTAPAAGRRRGAPALRVRLLPALRAGLLQRLPPHRRRRARPRRLPRRLHLRIVLGQRPRAQARRARAAHARATTARATRSTRPTRTCRRRTPPARGSSPGTTTRSTTTTPTTVAGQRRRRSSSSRAARRRLPAYYEHMPLPARMRPAGRRHAHLHAARLGRARAASSCSTTASTARYQACRAARRARRRRSSTSANARSSLDPARTMLGARAGALARRRARRARARAGTCSRSRRRWRSSTRSRARAGAPGPTAGTAIRRRASACWISFAANKIAQSRGARRRRARASTSPT